MGMGIPVFNHNPGPCKLFHGIVFYIFIIINKFYMLPFLISYVDWRAKGA